MRLAEGGLVQDHIKYMTEIYDKLSLIGEAISEEDLVVYLLATLRELQYAYDCLRSWC